jgi:hypothetical protein
VDNNQGQKAAPIRARIANTVLRAEVETMAARGLYGWWCLDLEMAA